MPRLKFCPFLIEITCRIVLLYAPHLRCVSATEDSHVTYEGADKIDKPKQPTNFFLSTPTQKQKQFPRLLRFLLFFNTVESSRTTNCKNGLGTFYANTSSSTPLSLEVPFYRSFYVHTRLITTTVNCSPFSSFSSYSGYSLSSGTMSIYLCRRSLQPHQIKCSPRMWCLRKTGLKLGSRKSKPKVMSTQHRACSSRLGI